MKTLSIKQMEFSIPEEVSLRMKPRQFDDICDDDASITSEISLDILAKERDEETASATPSLSSSGWNPDNSDYSLNVLLRSKDEEDQSTSDSAKDSLMTSDYSLNVRLSKSQHSLKSCSMTQALGASQHSFDTFATTRSVARSVETDLSENTSQKKVSMKKVAFFPRVRIQRVTNRKDLLKAQIKRVWYSRDEFTSIRRECFDTIKVMQDGGVVDEKEGFCTLGLEYKTKKNYRDRQRNKMEVRQVVFDEQQFQQENELPDPEWIARVSREQSRSCVEGALEIARVVEEEVTEYMGLNDRDQ